jgi:hypothetical protein
VIAEPAAGPVDRRGELGDRRRLEQSRERQVEVERLADA